MTHMCDIVGSCNYDKKCDNYHNCVLVDNGAAKEKDMNEKAVLESVAALYEEMQSLKEKVDKLQNDTSAREKLLWGQPFGDYVEKFIDDRVRTLEEQLDMLKERVDRIE